MHSNQIPTTNSRYTQTAPIASILLKSTTNTTSCHSLWIYLTWIKQLGYHLDRLLEFPKELHRSNFIGSSQFTHRLTELSRSIKLYLMPNSNSSPRLRDLMCHWNQRQPNSKILMFGTTWVFVVKIPTINWMYWNISTTICLLRNC